MAVSDVHRNYALRSPQWVRCRDAFEGTDVIKAKGIQYLPKLGNQKPSDYDAYLKRATWYGATARTVLGLTGSVMRKPPAAEVPEQVETHLQDVTRTNVKLDAFCAALVQEVVHVGRVGVLLDLPKTEVQGNPRPHWVKYDVEQIVNWRSELIDGVQTTTMIVLCEDIEEERPDDYFTRDCVKQYRVLRLIEGVYQVELWRRIAKEKNYSLQESITPRVRGASINYIPFVVINPLDLELDPCKPPLLDLVDVNLSHYLSSADLEHGRHFTALPTPYATGVAKETKLQIGSSVAWCIPAPEARVGMLEFTGQGLKALEVACETKEKQMAVLGARMLEEQKTQVEATETHAIRRSGEASLLASIAETISAGLTQIAKWHCEWVGAKASLDLVRVQLNKDFFGVPLGSSDLTALTQMLQSGGISYATFYHNLERGEMTRPGITAEEERLQIEAEAPMLDLGGDEEDDATGPPQSGEKPSQAAADEEAAKRGQPGPPQFARR